ncbi:hypothetical protein BDQ17DRAFT_995280 [Cyathus striatus]|nr:hypothetical protein BDQ17DRAFT_995280 [Cyathus striatus]
MKFKYEVKGFRVLFALFGGSEDPALICYGFVLAFFEFRCLALGLDWKLTCTCAQQAIYPVQGNNLQPYPPGFPVVISHQPRFSRFEFFLLSGKLPDVKLNSGYLCHFSQTAIISTAYCVVSCMNVLLVPVYSWYIHYTSHHERCMKLS